MADIVFSEICETLGNAPVFLLDLHPVASVMCVVCSHDVAEQITKASKAFPYSIPKAPSTRAFEDLLGPTSIVIAEVHLMSPPQVQLYWSRGALILADIGRGVEVTP